jgi:hypothetical protein
MSSLQDTDPDLSTQSNYEDILTTSVHFDWTVDFDTKTVNGSIELNLAVNKSGVSELMFVVHFYFLCPILSLAFNSLDTSELEIRRPEGAVTVNGKKKNASPKFSLH